MELNVVHLEKKFTLQYMVSLKPLYVSSQVSEKIHIY